MVMNYTNLIKNSVLMVLPVADFNEQEYLVSRKALESAGIKIFIASENGGVCVGAHSKRVSADINFINMKEGNFGGIVLIGGFGVKKYWNNVQLYQICRQFASAKKTVGAICSAVVVLARCGLLTGLTVSCYPDDIQEIEKEDVKCSDEGVSVNKNIITAQGPTFAGDFIQYFIEKFKK